MVPLTLRKLMSQRLLRPGFSLPVFFSGSYVYITGKRLLKKDHLCLLMLLQPSCLALDLLSESCLKNEMSASLVFVKAYSEFVRWWQESDLACGSDGQTYPSQCELDSTACREQTDLRLAYKGDCGESNANHYNITSKILVL